MLMAEETGGECQDDYVQFGRDILFITSHRINKYCRVIVGSVQSTPHNSSNEEIQTIFSESSDQEMDVLVKMTIASQETKTKDIVSDCDTIQEDMQLHGPQVQEVWIINQLCEG